MIHVPKTLYDIILIIIAAIWLILSIITIDWSNTEGIKDFTRTIGIILIVWVMFVTPERLFKYDPEEYD